MWREGNLDCGAASYTNEMIHAKIEGRLPQNEAVDGLDLGAIENVRRNACETTSRR